MISKRQNLAGEPVDRPAYKDLLPSEKRSEGAGGSRPMSGGMLFRSREARLLPEMPRRFRNRAERYAVATGRSREAATDAVSRTKPKPECAAWGPLPANPETLRAVSCP